MFCRTFERVRSVREYRRIEKECKKERRELERRGGGEEERGKCKHGGHREHLREMRRL